MAAGQAALRAALLAAAQLASRACTPHPRLPQVRQALGIRRTVISGGGSLAPHLDEFFEMAGLTVSLAELSRAELSHVALHTAACWCRPATAAEPPPAAAPGPADPRAPPALQVLNGWGLTETSPVLACRRAVPSGNVRGTAGLPIPGTQLRVVDPDTLEELAPGEQVGGRGVGV